MEKKKKKLQSMQFNKKTKTDLVLEGERTGSEQSRNCLFFEETTWFKSETGSWN